VTIPVTIRPSGGPCEADFEIETTLPTLRLETRMSPTAAQIRTIRAQMAFLELLVSQRRLTPTTRAVMELGRDWLDAHERPVWMEGDV